MLAPDLSIEDIEQQVDVARAEVAGANHALQDAERALENAQRAADECAQAKRKAVRRLDDVMQLQRMRSGIPDEVVRMRAEYGALWHEVNTTQDGEPTEAQRRRSSHLIREMTRLCPHPKVIACDGTSATQERCCVICYKPGTCTPDDVTSRAELRDMPERTVVVMSQSDFGVMGGEFMDLPNFAAITARYAALLQPRVPAEPPTAPAAAESTGSETIVGDGESG